MRDYWRNRLKNGRKEAMREWRRARPMPGFGFQGPLFQAMQAVTSGGEKAKHLMHNVMNNWDGAKQVLLEAAEKFAKTLLADEPGEGARPRVDVDDDTREVRRAPAEDDPLIVI